MAYELGTQVPDKDDSHVNPQEGVHPRQGGDTVFDATVIGGVPFNDAGTNAGYVNDYDEACPYTGSTSPDVVYGLIAAEDMAVDVDLCGSSYDTKLYIYDEGLGLVACNDDFYYGDPCGVYVSKLVGVPMIGGSQYFIVIDGYSGDFGDYLIEVSSFIVDPPCVLECPDGAALEGEPELMDGYVDEYNSGCGSPGNEPLDYVQVVQPGDFCAASGWYDDGFRDNDWFRITLGPEGFFSWDCDAEQPTYMFELLNMPDCANGEVGQIATAGPCLPANLTIYGAPGEQVFFWAGPTTFYPPNGFVGHEYDYVSFFDTSVIATEDATWSQLKAMYR
jgi:hypothetical protein